MLELMEEYRDGTCVVSCCGRLDSESVPRFDEWRERRITGESLRIIIDCSALEYISSIGLRSILTAYRHAGRCGATLLFCGLTGLSREVFQTAGLLSHLPVYTDLPEALASAPC